MVRDNRGPAHGASAVTCQIQKNCIHFPVARSSAAASCAGLKTGAASGAISAFNWAAWERKLNDTRRKEKWRAAAGNKVPGSRVTIYDTTPAPTPRVRARFNSMGDYTKLYGGALTGRMGSGQMTAKMTATMVMMTQQAMSRIMRPLQERINQKLMHLIDATAYGALVHGAMENKIRRKWAIHDEWTWGCDPEVKHEYYERASRWQSNLTDLDRSLSVTLSPEPARSRSDGNKSKHGWLSRMPKQSTAWPPKPRTAPIPYRRRPAPLA